MNKLINLTKDNVGIMILAQSVSQNPNDPHLGHALAVVGNAKINDQEKLIYWNPWDTELSIQMKIQAYYIYHSIVIITGMVQ